MRVRVTDLFGEILDINMTPPKGLDYQLHHLYPWKSFLRCSRLRGENSGWSSHVLCGKQN